MSVSRSEYQVAIKTSADTAGIDQAKAGFAGLTAQLKILEDDLALAQRTGVSVPQESLDQVAKLKKTISDYGQTLEKTGVSHREVHQGLHLVAMAAGDALGPIGELARMLGNPYIMAAAGAALAIKELVEVHQAAHDRIVKLIEDSREWERAMRSATDNAIVTQAQKSAELADHFAHLHDNIDLATEALKRFEAQNAIVLTSTLAHLKAQEALVAAYIHEQEVLGHFSSTEANYLTQRAQQRAAQAEETRKEAAEQADIDEAENTRRQNEALAQSERDKATALGAPGGARDLAQQGANAARAIAQQEAGKQAGLDAGSADAAANLPRLLELAKNLRGIATLQHGKQGGAESELAAQYAETQLKNAQTAIKAAKDNEEATLKAQNTASRQDALVKSIDNEIERHKAYADQLDQSTRALKQDDQHRQEKLDRQARDFADQQASEAELARVRRRTELEQAQQNGTITPSQALELAGMTDARRPGYTPGQGWNQGPQQDVARLTRQATDLFRHLSGENATDRANDPAMAQLQSVIDALFGLGLNTSATVRSLVERFLDMHPQIIEMQSQMNAMQSRLDNIRPNTGG